MSIGCQTLLLIVPVRARLDGLRYFGTEFALPESRNCGRFHAMCKSVGVTGCRFDAVRNSSSMFQSEMGSPRDCNVCGTTGVGM